MAMKFAVASAHRVEIWEFLPEDIEVDLSANGRAEPASAEVVRALADSIRDNGQLEPVVVRKLPGHKVQLVAGYTRHAAVSLLNREEPAPRKLRCTVIECSPEEGFLKNLVENLDRSGTTPIDDAHNHRRLREDFGWTDARIAELYSKSVSYISQLRKLVSLPAVVQQDISNGNLAVNAALDVAQLPEQEQVEVVQQAKEESGRVNSGKVRNVVRKRLQEQKAGGEIVGKAALPRSVKELRDFFLACSKDLTLSERLNMFAAATVDYISGLATDEQMFLAVRALENVDAPAKS